MKNIKFGYSAAFVLFLCLKAQAQNYPINPLSQPQVVVPSAPPYSTYQAAPVNVGQPAVIQQATVMVVPQGVVVPPGAVYIAPTYPAPAVGFIWAYHPRYGWGWRHPAHGWHRGWR